MDYLERPGQCCNSALNGQWLLGDPSVEAFFNLLGVPEPFGQHLQQGIAGALTVFHHARFCHGGRHRQIGSKLL